MSFSRSIELASFLEEEHIKKLKGAVVKAKYVVNGVEVAASKRFDVNL